jgi:hypothetical protein
VLILRSVKKMEITQHSRYACPNCGKVGPPAHDSDCTKLTCVFLSCVAFSFLPPAVVICYFS